MGAPALGACVFARVISSCCTDPCGITKWSPSQPFTFFPFTLWAPPHWPLWLGLAAFPGVFVPKPALLSSFSPGGEVTQAVVRGRSSAFSTLSPDLWFPAKRALSPPPPPWHHLQGTDWCLEQARPSAWPQGTTSPS